MKPATLEAPAAAPGTRAATKQLGVVGIDSSHFPEFTKRIHALHAEGQAACRVARYWTDGRHRMPASEVEKWRGASEAEGVRAAASHAEMLDEVDGVLVLAVDGGRHLELAAPSLERGLPTYVDKPLTCDLASARALLELSRKHGAPCYSASSLRFAVEVETLDRDALGEMVAVDATGPGELNDAMPRLFFYGVHTVELVDAIWGPGVKRVRATAGDARDRMELEYRDGRYAHLRLERRGSYSFAATVHGTKALRSFEVDFAPVYSRLVRGMTRFFGGGAAPVALRDIVENIATLEAGQRSLAKGGAWVDVEPVE